MAKQTANSSKRTTFWAVLFGLASLGVISIASLFVWQKMGQVELGLHGWLALVAGAVGSVLLGGGLMALSFYSARSGYDDAAHDDSHHDNDHHR